MAKSYPCIDQCSIYVDPINNIRAREPGSHFVADTMSSPFFYLSLSLFLVAFFRSRGAEFYFAASSRFSVDLYRRTVSSKKTPVSRQTSFLSAFSLGGIFANASISSTPKNPLASFVSEATRTIVPLKFNVNCATNRVYL